MARENQTAPSKERQKIYERNKGKGKFESYDTTAQCMVNAHDKCAEMDPDMIGKCICKCHRN